MKTLLDKYIEETLPVTHQIPVSQLIVQYELESTGIVELNNEKAYFVSSFNGTFGISTLWCVRMEHGNKFLETFAPYKWELNMHPIMRRVIDGDEAFHYFDLNLVT